MASGFKTGERLLKLQRAFLVKAGVENESTVPKKNRPFSKPNGLAGGLPRDRYAFKGSGDATTIRSAFLQHESVFF